MDYTRNSYTAAIDYTTFPHEHHEQAVHDWNERFPIGTLVCLWRDNGEALVTRTRTEAKMGHNGAMIWVEGVSGSYNLGAARPVSWDESAFSPVFEDIKEQESKLDVHKNLYHFAYIAEDSGRLAEESIILNTAIKSIVAMKRAINLIKGSVRNTPSRE